MLNLLYHKKDFKIKCVSWNNFAPYHGKSPCDGNGGTIKRTVTRSNLQNPPEKQVLTPKAMYDFCKEKIHGIRLYV